MVKYFKWHAGKQLIILTWWKWSFYFYCQSVILLSNIRSIVDPKWMHVRVAQRQLLYSLCVTAGQELHAKLFDCFVFFYLAWLRLQYTSCQQLHTIPQWLHAQPQPLIHAVSFYYFFVFLPFFKSLFMGQRHVWCNLFQRLLSIFSKLNLLFLRDLITLLIYFFL